MSRDALSSETRGRGTRGGMMMLWEDCLRGTKIPEMTEFKRMGRERQPADIHSWGGNIFGNLIQLFTQSFLFFFSSYTRTKTNTLCTHNNFIQSTHVNKNMQLIPHITTLPENILGMLFIKPIFSQKVIPTKVILKHPTLKLFSLGIPYGQWAEKGSFKRKLRAKA